jgi:single-stranded DNA-binding protein
VSRLSPVPDDQPPDHSITLLVGHLSRDPERRVLPSGSTVLAFEVSTRPREGPVESVPVAWLDPPDRATFVGGDQVVVLGRTKRRFFRATGATQSRTEVVADRVVLARHQSRASSLLGQALERVAAAAGEDAPS